MQYSLRWKQPRIFFFSWHGSLNQFQLSHAHLDWYMHAICDQELVGLETAFDTLLIWLEFMEVSGICSFHFPECSDCSIFHDQHRSVLMSNHAYEWIFMVP